MLWKLMINRIEGFAKSNNEQATHLLRSFDFLKSSVQNMIASVVEYEALKPNWV